MEEYQQLYRRARGFAAIGDLSPIYLWEENAAKRIYKVSPTAKIIIMLRDPVVRAHSYYLMHLRIGGESALSFKEALRRDSTRNKSSWFTSWQYVEAGLYSAQVRRYLDVFGRDQVLIRLFDDLAKDPEGLFAGIARHIGVDPTLFGGADLSEAYNTFKAPRFALAYRIARSAPVKKLRQKVMPRSAQKWLKSSPFLYRTKKPPLDDESRQLLQKTYDPDISCLEEMLGRKLPELRKSWV